jgi:uncharacterized SAM-binding protein YcdF (DUF218 family)
VKFDRFPLVVVLGSQVHHDESTREYSLAEHTRMKVEAAAIALRQGMTEQMIFSGGYNFGVRYDDGKILNPPDFSFPALSTAQVARTSEARAMRNVAVDDFGAKSQCILLEEMSATTEENAFCVDIMLKRTTFTNVKNIGILALFHHLPRALAIFRSACAYAGFEFYPVIAENLLATKGETAIDKIAKYYGVPRGGRQHDAKRIRQLLSEGKSLAEMME